MEFITDNSPTKGNTYDTVNFFETCFLLAKDMKMTSAVRDTSRDMLVFTFANKPLCEKLVKDLTMGNDEVSASRFAEAQRRAKKLIHDNK